MKRVNKLITRRLVRSRSRPWRTPSAWLHRAPLRCSVGPLSAFLCVVVLPSVRLSAWLSARSASGGGYNCDSTSIRRPFDSQSTVYQRSLRSQWHNPLVAVTLTYYLFIYLFIIYLFIQSAVQQPARNVGRRVVSARSTCQSNGGCNHRLSVVIWSRRPASRSTRHWFQLCIVTNHYHPRRHTHTSAKCPVHKTNNPTHCGALRHTTSWNDRARLGENVSRGTWQNRLFHRPLS